MRGALAGFVCILLVAPGAMAQELERVDTKDGSTYRGELVERVLDDHVTLKLATGEVKRFEWSEIATPPKAAPAPVAKPSPRRASTTIDVELTVDDERARLEKFVGTGTVDVDHVTTTGVTLYTTQEDIDLYRDVCGAPCNVEIDPTARYRIGGTGLVPTDGFRLGNAGPNRIEGVMSTKSKRTAGKVLTYLGIPLTVLGGLLLAVAPGSSDVPACNGCVRFQSSLYLWGGIVTGIGVPLLTIGIVLWATSGSSALLNGRQVGVRLPGGLELTSGGLSF